MQLSSRTLHIHADLFGAVQRNPDDPQLHERFQEALALAVFQASNAMDDFKISLLRDMTDIAPIRRELSVQAATLSDHFMMFEMMGARFGVSDELASQLLDAMERFERLSLDFDYITHSPAPGLVNTQRPGQEPLELSLTDLLDEMTDFIRLMNSFAMTVCKLPLTRITEHFAEVSWKIDSTETDIDFYLQNLMMRKIFAS